MTTTGKHVPAFISTQEHAHPIFSPYPADEGIYSHLDLSQG